MVAQSVAMPASQFQGLEIECGVYVLPMLMLALCFMKLAIQQIDSYPKSWHRQFDMISVT